MKYDAQILRGTTLIIDDAIVNLHEDGTSGWFSTERTGVVTNGDFCRMILSDKRSGNIRIDDVEESKSTNSIVKFTVVGALTWNEV